MADRSHRTRWLLNAADAVGDSTAAQIVWLKAKRVEYAALVDAGDWQTTDVNGEGGMSKSMRGVSDQMQHDAIVDALRYLGSTDLGSTGSLLQVQFNGIQF